MMKSSAKSFLFFIFWLSFFLYVFAVFLLTVGFVELKFSISAAGIQNAFAKINTLPYVRTKGVFLTCKNILGDYTPFYEHFFGNFLLFSPMAFFAKFKFKMGGLKFWLLGLFCSLCVETLQLLLNIFSGRIVRIVDVDDVILNTAGYLFFAVVLSLAYRKLKKLHNSQKG
jgi:glycopeptide antibiotics resistance protein